MPVALVGTGAMGSALARSWIEAGMDPPDLTVCDKDAARAQSLANELGCRTSPAAGDAVAGALAILLAVKPQDIDGLADAACRAVPGATCVSILAGVRTSRLETLFGPRVGVVRAMPNLAVTVGAGVSAVVPGARAGDKDVERAIRLLGCSGEVLRLPAEDQMDAVTALSGSGPAYFLLLAEALAEAGVAAGLPEALAGRLAAGTAVGAGALLSRSRKAPADLRRGVTSPGGTTESALAAFAEGGFRPLVRRAVEAAAARSRELSSG